MLFRSQVNDMTAHIHLAYEQELHEMREARSKNRKKKTRNDSGAGSGDEVPEEEAEEEPKEITEPERRFKKSSSVSRYGLYRRAGLGQLVAAFGIPVVKLGESMRDGYCRFEIETPNRAPVDVAAEYKHLGSVLLCLSYLCVSRGIGIVILQELVEWSRGA